MKAQPALYVSYWMFSKFSRTSIH